MARKSSPFSALMLVILIGIVFQVALVYADRQDTPSRAAIEFAKAYYQVDPAMADRICESKMNQGYIVDLYIERVAAEARERGFELSYLRNYLHDVRTHVISLEEDSEAKVRLTAVRKPFIRSLFTGEEYEVDEIFHLVKEDNKWKVCGNLLGVTQG